MIRHKWNKIGRDYGAGGDELVIIVKPGILTESLDVKIRFLFLPRAGESGYIDWGDGAFTTTSGDHTHSYSEAGTYTIKMKRSNSELQVGFNTPDVVYWSNMNIAALGNNAFQFNCRWPNFDAGYKKATVLLPDNQGNIYSFFQDFAKNYSGATKIVIRSIPDSVGSIQTAFLNSKIIVDIDRLPANVSSIWATFQDCGGNVYRIGKWADNAPAGGYVYLTNIGYMLNRITYYGGSIDGTVASFMHKCPNVTIVMSAFNNNTAVDTFGTDDYFEVVLTTTAANQSWGFTPTSSAGTWYCYDWGDGTAVTSNKNLDMFTSGTRIAHTFAAPGTYHIKLAMNASEIAFDAYDSDNGKWELLGNSTH